MTVRVVMLSLSSARNAAAVDDIMFVLAKGGRVTLVTSDISGWGEMDPRISVLQLSAQEQAYWALRAERFLVFTMPDLPLRVVRRVVSGVARRSREPVKQILTTSAKRLNRMRRSTRAVSSRFHTWYFMKPYSYVRPWVLWRVARKNVLPRLDISTADQVVVADALATPLGWHIARALPDVAVGFTLDRNIPSRVVCSGRTRDSG
jgi:hypothetical protein